MSGDSSSSTFHHFQEFIISNYQKSRNSEFQNSKNGHFMFFMNSSFLISKNPGILNFKNSRSGFIISNQQKSRNSEFQKFKKWTPKVSKISKFLSSRFRRNCFSHFFQGCSLIFLDLIKVFWSNKMKKYGLPGPKTLRNDEMLSFRCLMP